jgi:hypothetical protein
MRALYTQQSLRAVRQQAKSKANAPMQYANAYCKQHRDRQAWQAPPSSKHAALHSIDPLMQWWPSNLLKSKFQIYCLALATVEGLDIRKCGRISGGR